MRCFGKTRNLLSVIPTGRQDLPTLVPAGAQVRLPPGVGRVGRGQPLGDGQRRGERRRSCRRRSTSGSASSPTRCDATGFIYIGLCYGPPGVGKTLSARHYSRWDATENCLAHQQQPTLDRFTLCPPEALEVARTVFWTAPVAVTAGQVSRYLLGLCDAVDAAIRRIPDAGWRPRRRGTSPHVELVVSTRPIG
jgi:hypothetical protein